MSEEPARPAPVEELARPTALGRLKRLLIGMPRDLEDRRLFHRLSLIPLLAWVGLGADGLSSSAYGPEAAFLALGDHRHFALILALASATTVFVISAAYAYIIEEFPSGGGGYSVASKLLGPYVGLVSGCALLVDYVLTITVSIAAAGDAVFSLLPGAPPIAKGLLEIVFILGLTVLNLRGVRESILALMPIFFLFLLTHLVLIVGGIWIGWHDWQGAGGSIPASFSSSHAELGLLGTLLLLARAYSLGGGTYTGIEAVSNGMPIMREPKIPSARRTMLYMAVSLSLTAAGLLLCFFLRGTSHDPSRTLNAVLAEDVGRRLHLGSVFAVLTLLAEGALLVVAAQTGFLDGPRVLANMAVDSWVPRRFASLSDRLTTQNGIVLVGGAALVALVYTRGHVGQLVVMYSVNVFLTFTLSMLAMLNFWRHARPRKGRKRRTALFGVSFAMCASLFTLTVSEKFLHGAWLTLVVTGACILVCILIHRHYRSVNARLAGLDDVLLQRPKGPRPELPELRRDQATAAVFVGGYSGVGVHTLLSILKTFPDHYRNFIFLSVGVVDSGVFKGAEEIDALRDQTEANLRKYVDFARANGLPALSRVAIGTEVAAAAEELSAEVIEEFPRTVFFASKVVFPREEWGHRILHNETAYAVQRRLQTHGRTLVVLPVSVR